MNIKLKIILVALTCILTCCSKKKKQSTENNFDQKSISNIEFIYIQSHPHNITSFTEGLLIHGEMLYESTGSPKGLPQTKSLFGTVDLKTGNIDVQVELDSEKYFWEGIVIFEDRIYQLTYKSRKGFVYDLKSFAKIQEFEIPSKEGWGLTTDSVHLIMSNGTNELYFLDPESLQVVKKISVTENGYLKEYLNELEYIKGYIFANVWTTNTVIKINTTDGRVVGKLDLTELAKEAEMEYGKSLEMNGIAYNHNTENVFITGKLWPKIFEIKLVEN